MENVNILHVVCAHFLKISFRFSGLLVGRKPLRNLDQIWLKFRSTFDADAMCNVHPLKHIQVS